MIKNYSFFSIGLSLVNPNVSWFTKSWELSKNKTAEDAKQSNHHTFSKSFCVFKIGLLKLRLTFRAQPSQSKA